MRSSKWIPALSMIVAANTAACLSEPPETTSNTEAVSRAPAANSCGDDNPAHRNWVDCCGDGVCYAPNTCKVVACGTFAPPAQPLGCGGPDSGLVDCCGDGWCIAPEVCRFTECAS